MKIGGAGIEAANRFTLENLSNFLSPSQNQNKSRQDLEEFCHQAVARFVAAQL
jgi:hypothetical protein